MICCQQLTNSCKIISTLINCKKISTPSASKMLMCSWGKLSNSMEDLTWWIWIPMDRWCLFWMLRWLLPRKEHCFVSPAQIQECCVDPIYPSATTFTVLSERRCTISMRYTIYHAECSEDPAFLCQFSSQSTLQVHSAFVVPPNRFLRASVCSSEGGKKRMRTKWSQDRKYLQLWILWKLLK